MGFATQLYRLLPTLRVLLHPASSFAVRPSPRFLCRASSSIVLPPPQSHFLISRTMATGRKRNRTGQQLETWDTPRAEEIVDIQQEADSGEVTPNGGKGKKRGKTTLQVIPTGESQSVKFSSAVGCIVREQVPINVKDWRLVTDKPKNEVWGLLLQQYKVEEIHKTYIFQQMGRLWRAYKNELTNTVLATLDSHRSRTETARLIGSIRPVCVPQNDWDEFVAERSSHEWRVKRGKMQEVGAK